MMTLLRALAIGASALIIASPIVIAAYLCCESLRRRKSR